MYTQYVVYIHTSLYVYTILHTRYIHTRVRTAGSTVTPVRPLIRFPHQVRPQRRRGEDRGALTFHPCPAPLSGSRSLRASDRARSSPLVRVSSLHPIKSAPFIGLQAPSRSATLFLPFSGFSSLPLVTPAVPYYTLHGTRCLFVRTTTNVTAPGDLRSICFLAGRNVPLESPWKRGR